MWLSLKGVSRCSLLAPVVRPMWRFTHEQTFLLNNEVVSNLLLWSDVFTFVENLFSLAVGASIQSGLKNKHYL